MGRKILSVSLGIPAYNEESNIKNLIVELLEQERSNFFLSEIIVVSDQSMDNTVTEVKSIKNRKLRVFQNKKRIGQALSQNIILEEFKGDVLVLLNADILPKNKKLISNLVKPFYKNTNLGLVGGRVEPLPGVTLVEKIISYTHQLKQEMYESISKDNVYLCHGRVRAFSNSFAKKFKWKPVYGEDAFSYLMCKKLNYDFQYVPNATVMFRSPQTVKDHIKQSTRFFNANREFSKCFDDNLYRKEYYISLKLYLNKSFHYFRKNPVLLLLYIPLFLISKLESQFIDSSHVWETSMSSKRLKLGKVK